MSRDPRLYLDDMIEAAQRALAFGAGLERDAYCPGNMAFEAIVRQIEVIGEAAVHVPQDVQGLAPAIPWADVVGMRNRLIHGYFAVEAEIVRSVVRDKLPTMLSELKQLTEKLS